MVVNRIRCEITQLELGTELEDASRYAEIMAGRLEIVCDALEAIGLARRAEVMREWLGRWLRVVDVLFEARLAEQSLMLPDVETRILPDVETRISPDVETRALSDLEKLN